MAAIEEILSELEEVTARMAPVERQSLETFGELCGRRAELIRQLSGRLEPRWLERATAIVRAGDEAARALNLIRHSLRQDLGELALSLHVARQWGANVAVPRKEINIHA